MLTAHKLGLVENKCPRTVGIYKTHNYIEYLTHSLYY